MLSKFIKLIIESFNPELEQYRQSAIQTLKLNANELKEIAEKILEVKIINIYIIGSLVNKNKFNENSDIDIAFIVDKNLDINDLTEILQIHYNKQQFYFESLGFIDVMVLNRKPKGIKIF